MKITSFIIALILVGVIAATYTLSIATFTAEYGVTYDENSLEAYNSAQELYNLTMEIENKTNEQSTESGLFDVVGSYIGRAIDALKLAKQSTTTFNTMASAAADDLQLPAYFKTAAYAIIIILIVLGVIISAMIKYDL